MIRDWESVLVRNEKKLSGKVRPAGPLACRFENSRDAKCEKSDTRRRMSPKSGPKRLRELLQQRGIICSLGAHDVFTALIVEQAGFAQAMSFAEVKELLGVEEFLKLRERL